MATRTLPRHLWKIWPLLSLCLLLATVQCRAQQQLISKLKASLPRFGTDSLQYANSLNRISSLYLVQHLDSSRRYAENARELCERLKYPKGLADAYMNLGGCFTFMNNNSLAYRLYLESLQRYRHLGDSAGISLALANIGAYYHYQGQPRLAVPYLQEAVSIGSRLLRDSLWMPVLTSYYVVFAKDSLRRDSARWALHKAHDIATRYHDGHMIAYTGLFMGHEKMREGQLTAAMENIGRIVQKVMPAGLAYLSVYGNAQLDRYASHAGLRDSVLYRERMLDAAIAGGYKKLAVAPATSLYRFYKKAGAHEKMLQFADVMYDISMQQAVQGEQDYMEAFLQEKEQKAQYLSNALQQQSQAAEQLQAMNRSLTLLVYAVAGMLILGLIGALVYVQRKSIKKSKRFKEVTRLALDRNRELQRQDDFKSKLLSVISHDFRLPLSQIINITELFRRSDIPPEHFRDMAFSIATTANETLQLFETVLNWVKSQLSGFEYVPRPHQVRILLEEAVEPVAADITDKAIILDILVEEGLIVHADREMLQFVNRNLLHNAVKYSRRGCRIVVAGAMRKGHVVVSVTNEGSGISEVDMPHIFRHRVPGTYARETGKGAGLALIICKDFIEKMGGTIIAKTDHVSYATFEYVL